MIDLGVAEDLLHRPAVLRRGQTPGFQDDLLKISAFRITGFK